MSEDAQQLEECCKAPPPWNLSWKPSWCIWYDTIR